MPAVPTGRCTRRFLRFRSSPAPSLVTSGVAYAYGGHWHDDPLWIPRDDARSLEAVVEVDGDKLPLGDAYTLALRIANDPSDVLLEDNPDDGNRGDRVSLHGTGDGFTALVFQVLEDSDVVYETPALETEVGNHDHGHSHSHGSYDAKSFSEPVRAKRDVENVRDGLIELDPDNETTYEENATIYLEALESLHRQYERWLSDREQDTVVLAGHDSFRYLGDRYGFEIHTPVGLSPIRSPRARKSPTRSNSSKTAPSSTSSGTTSTATDSPRRSAEG